jgi:2-iminobutanoate/2-iminopropanoate deaminase
MMPKRIPELAGFPPSTDPYSQVVEAGDLVFLAGQVASDPGTSGTFPGGIKAETKSVFDNVGRLLGAIGLDIGSLVRCTIYLTDFNDFADMNVAFEEYFPENPPTRTTVGVTRLARNCRIEVEATATR